MFHTARERATSGVKVLVLYPLSYVLSHDGIRTRDIRINSAVDLQAFARVQRFDFFHTQ